MLIHHKKCSSIRHPEIIDKSKHCSAFRVRGHDFTQVINYRISLSNSFPASKRFAWCFLVPLFSTVPHDRVHHPILALSIFMGLNKNSKFRHTLGNEIFSNYNGSSLNIFRTICSDVCPVRFNFILSITFWWDRNSQKRMIYFSW